MVESNAIHLKIKTPAGNFDLDINPTEKIAALKD